MKMLSLLISSLAIQNNILCPFCYVFIMLLCRVFIFATVNFREFYKKL